jgi:hypothetical protein
MRLACTDQYLLRRYGLGEHQGPFVVEKKVECSMIELGACLAYEVTIGLAMGDDDESAENDEVESVHPLDVKL